MSGRRNPHYASWTLLPVKQMGELLHFSTGKPERREMTLLVPDWNRRSTWAKKKGAKSITASTARRYAGTTNERDVRNGQQRPSAEPETQQNKPGPETPGQEIKPDAAS